jgi:1,4-dihydroxy-2-naphthoate octaprenyltransferase
VSKKRRKKRIDPNGSKADAPAPNASNADAQRVSRAEPAVGEPSAPLPAKGSVGAWILAARVRTLPVAFAPVALGAAISYATAPTVRWGPIFAALAAALLIQIGTNFANDVFDYEKGADNAERIGPPRAVQAGLLTPRALKLGMIVAFGLATALGAYLTVTVGKLIPIIGVASILSGIAYTGGPFPLAYNGLGDLFVFAFFGGVAVVGSVYVGSGQFPLVAFLGAISVGALATAVLVVNNVRDHETDARVKKKTLVVRFGRRFGVVEYCALLVIAFAVPGVMIAVAHASPWVLLSLALLPRALRVASTVAFRTDGPTLTKQLAATAQLLLGHTLLVSLGLAMPKAPF